MRSECGDLYRYIYNAASNEQKNTQLIGKQDVIKRIRLAGIRYLYAYPLPISYLDRGVIALFFIRFPFPTKNFVLSPDLGTWQLTYHCHRQFFFK